MQRWLRTKELTHGRACPHAALQFPGTMTQLFMHAVKQDVTHLLFLAMVCHILQMHTANCGNDTFLEIENERNKNTSESKKQFTAVGY